MADQTPEQKAAAEAAAAEQKNQNKNSVKYFRSNIAGLSVVVGHPEGAVNPSVVRFTPILQRWDGEMQKFGYLKTDNKVAIKKCKEDPNVTEIDQDEYEKVLAKADDGGEPNVKRVA